VKQLLENKNALGLLFMLPAGALLLVFLTYPLGLGTWLGFTDAKIGRAGEWVGLENFQFLIGDSVARLSLFNTLFYTVVASVLKFVLGLWLALLLNRHFKGKAFARAFILLPFIIPTVLSTFAWKWMFDPTFSVLNWLLYHIGAISGRINWLGDPDLAMVSIIIVNIWRGVPFFAISLLAGLQTISPELNEAAAIDGAKPWARFWYITWPLLLPVTMVVVLFSVIQTFADFQIVYVMTGGGPANATHLFATYAYQIGIGTGLLSEGAAISLAMFPILFLVVIIQLLYIRRVEVR